MVSITTESLSREDDVLYGRSTHVQMLIFAWLNTRVCLLDAQRHSPLSTQGIVGDH